MRDEALRESDAFLRIAHVYFERLSAQPVPRSLTRPVPFVVKRSRSRAPRPVASLAAFALLGLVILLVSVGVSHELSNRHGAFRTPPPTATSTAVPAASAPPGGPVPPALSGDWILSSGTTSSGPELIFQGSTYELTTSGGISFGMVTVNGSEIDFYSGSSCRIPLPGGVGRYQWRLDGNVLRFTPLKADPCGGRTRPVANQTYVHHNG